MNLSSWYRRRRIFAVSLRIGRGRGPRPRSKNLKIHFILSNRGRRKSFSVLITSSYRTKLFSRGRGTSETLWWGWRPVQLWRRSVLVHSIRETQTIKMEDCDSFKRKQWRKTKCWIGFLASSSNTKRKDGFRGTEIKICHLVIYATRYRLR